MVNKMQIFCRECGKKISATANACPSCGARQKSAHSQKSKITAGLLAILLGGIGVHKFYLEQIGMGILYLLFCWTFIPAIIGFIEGIIYLTMSDEAFEEKYSK